MARILVKFSLAGAAALAGLMVAVPALAYVVGSGSSETAPATDPAGVGFTITATFVQPSGAPFPAGVSVTFSEAGAVAHHTGTSGVRLMAAVKPAAGCTISFSPASTTTNSAGQASTSVSDNTGCAGESVTLTSSATGSSSGSVSATVMFLAAASAAPSSSSSSSSSSGTSFPNTGTLPPSGSSQQPWLAATVFGGGAALLIALVGFMVWRQRRGSRPEA